MAERADAALQVPLRVRRDDARGAGRGARTRGIHALPLPRHERRQQPHDAGVDAGASRRGAVAAHDAAELRDEGVVRPRARAARALPQRGCPPGERHDAQQIGVQDAARSVLAEGQRSQPADEQQVLLRPRLRLAEPVRRLDHRARGGVALVVGRDVGAVGSQRLGLLHDVEGASGVQLHIGDHERLQTCAEARRRTAHALRDRTHLAVPAAQHRDDAVGFTQLVGAQDHDVVAIGGHPSIIVRGPDTASAPRGIPRRPLGAPSVPRC